MRGLGLARGGWLGVLLFAGCATAPPSAPPRSHLTRRAARPPEELVSTCLVHVTLNEDTVETAVARFGTNASSTNDFPGQVLCYAFSKSANVLLLHAGGVDGGNVITGVDLLTPERARSLSQFQDVLARCVPLSADLEEPALFPLVRPGMNRKLTRRLLGSPRESRGATDTYSSTDRVPGPDGRRGFDRFQGVELVFDKDRVVQVSIFRVHLS
jgi:hypothetical protein